MENGERGGERRRGEPLVVHVVTRLVIGGPTRPLRLWVAGLAGEGFRAVLAAGTAGPEEVPAPPGPAVPAWEVPGLRREPAPLSDLRALLALARGFRALRPAIVHTHTAKAGVLGRVAARLCRPRPRVVHTFHGHSLSREAGGPLAPLWTRIERALVPWTDRLLVVAPRVAADLALRLALPAEPGVLPLPVPVAAPLAEGTVPRGRRGRRVALFLGRGVPVKGLDLLARAHGLAESRRRPGEAGLAVRVVGPVEARVRGELDRLLAAAGIAGLWEFRGPVDDPVPELLDADLLVLPSRSEGTPVSVLEALGAGLPVVAAAVGGVPELLAARWIRGGPTRWRTAPAPARGLLVPPGDVGAWADALTAAARDPGRVPGSPAERRRFVREVFDPAGRIADLAAAYRELAGLAAPRPAPSPLPAERKGVGARRAADQERAE